MKQGTLKCIVTKALKNEASKYLLDKGDEFYMNLVDYLKNTFKTYVFSEQGLSSEVTLNRDEFKVIQITSVVTEEIKEPDEVLKFLEEAKREVRVRD